MPKTIEFTQKAVKAYLDGAIQKWRQSKNASTPGSDDDLISACYVDAYQSVRVSLFGELLP